MREIKPTVFTPIEFWCQEVLPATYDDSISYYEVLTKISQKINEIIQSQNDVTSNLNIFETDITDKVDIINNKYKFSVQFKDLTNKSVDLNDLIAMNSNSITPFICSVFNGTNKPDSTSDLGILILLAYDLSNQIQIYKDVKTNTEYFRIISGEHILNYSNWTKNNSSLNYNELKNKPKINGQELIGNKTGLELGIVQEVIDALPKWNGGKY